MALYRYVKAESIHVHSKKIPRIFSYVSIGLGLSLLLWIAWPIIAFNSYSEQIFSTIINPIVDSQTTVRASSLSQIAYAATPPIGVAESTAPEFSNVNAWYPASPQKHISSQVNTYELSIPKLKIHNALVTISGDDLVDSLVHYGGTGLPGQYGSAVIFGHSALPQFYSPTNYKAIFSLLPSLKKGDDILVTFDGVNYRYSIYDMVVKEPTDLSVLEQQFDDSYISLVTCVPPGTTWKRLHVLAKLSSF